MGLVLCLLVVASAIKLVGVQVGDGSELAERGEDQRIRSVDLEAQRGSVLDRNGVELAISVPTRRVVTDMAALREQGIEDRSDIEQLARRLAPVLEVDAGALAGALLSARADDPWVRLAESVDLDAADAAVELVEEDGLVGVLTLEDSNRRVHPAGDSGLRLLGTLSPDGPGELAGVERAYDDQLTGRPGRKVVELGAEGETIAGSDRVVEEPEPGGDVVVTLDRTLQHEVERILADGADRSGASAGVAIVGRPDTGEVLAAGAVARDPDTGELGLSDHPAQVSDAYQAGSVFKLVTVAAAVEAGVVDAGTTLEVEDRIELDERTFSDHDRHATEPMTVSEIVARSSNVGTIGIALELGEERLHQSLVDFGFGEQTGIGHPAESGGILPPVADWTRPDLAASAIGTHQTATALQLWAAYNVIANDGVYVAPRLVDAVTDASGQTRRVPAVPRRRVVSEDTAAAVGSMLQQVVSEGTGSAFQLPGYAVAAKTGTSRLPAPDPTDPSDAYVWSDGRYHHLAAFAGYLPADRPEVSITVLLVDVDEGLAGATAAGPVFSDLAELSIRELGISPAGAGDEALSMQRVRAAPAAGDEAAGNGVVG